jgi:hypothetical protein
MSATMNGRPPRKQLSDELGRLETQLDRHDAILDALADGLNEAVKDAATEGTRLAVKDALVEILTDPALRAALHTASAPPVKVKKESAWDRLKARVRQAATTAKGAGVAVVAAVAARAVAVRTAAGTVGTAARWAWRLRTGMLIGLGVGAVVAGVSYLTSHSVAAALSGAGAAVTAGVVQAGLWARRTVKRLAFA